MNIGIGSFCCFQKRNPQPATFFGFWILVFWFDGGWGCMYERQVHFLGSGPAFFVVF